MFTSPLSVRHSWKWFFFTFLAGNLNAGAFLACGHFVTHTTGSFTLFGVQLAAGKVAAAIHLLSLPVYFLLGSVLSGLLVERRALQKKKPLYSVALFFVTALLLLLTIGSEFGFFGTWGDYHQGSRKNYYILVLLSIASGIQNATISSASGATVRTTHMTGITTDIGTSLVRIFFQHNESQKLWQELKVFWLRIGTLATFGIGAAAGTYLYLKFQFKGFWLPTIVSFIGCALAFNTENPKR